VSGEFVVSGLGFPNANLVDDRNAATRINQRTWTTITGLSARAGTVGVEAWGGSPGTAEPTSMSVGARNVTYTIERTRDIQGKGRVESFPQTFGKDLRGLSLSFDIEASTQDNFTYPCALVACDSPDATRPNVSRELGRLTGTAVKRSFVAAPPIKLDMGAACGERKREMGNDATFQLTNVRIFRP
jgi:hypothetical protein